MRIDASTRAIVTGASKGIGRATAFALARRGARLGLVARGREDLDQLAAELPESPAGGHIVLPADVSKRSQIERAIERFAKRAGGLDLLVANAGLADYAPFADQEAEAIERMVAVNVMGTIWTVRAGARPDARCRRRSRCRPLFGRRPACLPMGRRLRRDEGGRPRLRRGAAP